MDGALRAQLSRLSPAASARVSRQREYWAAASSPAPFFRTRVGWPGGIVGSTRRRNDAIPGFRGAVRSDGAAETTLEKRGRSLEQAAPRLVFICETGWIGRGGRASVGPPRRRFRRLHELVLARRPPPP